MFALFMSEQPLQKETNMNQMVGLAWQGSSVPSGWKGCYRGSCRCWSYSFAGIAIWAGQRFTIQSRIGATQVVEQDRAVREAHLRYARGDMKRDDYQRTMAELGQRRLSRMRSQASKHQSREVLVESGQTVMI
jgi:hypothetical protein